MKTIFKNTVLLLTAVIFLAAFILPFKGCKKKMHSVNVASSKMSAQEQESEKIDQTNVSFSYSQAEDFEDEEPAEDPDDEPVGDPEEGPYEPEEEPDEEPYESEDEPEEEPNEESNDSPEIFPDVNWL